MRSVDHVRQPFPEQITFFRNKLGNLLPTKKWTDVWKSAHDTGFMVAGAQKAALLADLGAAIEKTQSEGKSIQWFRKNFDTIVKEHGWAHTGSRNWRTRVIYQTNMNTAYAAGRLAQLRDPELMKSNPYWMYKHNDSVSHPRPLHVSWSGLTLPADDPWYQTHYPPNGWGCKCRVVAVNKRQAKAQGGRMESPPHDGKGKAGQPAGIDKGWDYMPGDTVTQSLQKQLAANSRKLPDPLRQGVMTAIRTQDAEKRIVALGAQSVAFNGSRTVAAHITPVVEEMAARKIYPPDVIRAITKKERAQYKAQGINMDTVIAGFTVDPNGQSYLLFDPQSPVWLDIETFTKKNHDRGFWSTASPRHAMRHEYGHLLHWRNAPEVWAAKTALSAEEKVVASKVSRYAKDNGAEFVAEVFAALMDGVSLPADVMVLYASLGGIRP